MRFASTTLVALAAACVVCLASSTVVEFLQLEVPCSETQRFVEVDYEVWTLYLANQTAFEDKQVWVAPNASTNTGNCSVWSVIHWKTRAGWKSIPTAQLIAKNAEFIAKFGSSPPLKSFPTGNGFDMLYNYKRDENSSQ